MQIRVQTQVGGVTYNIVVEDQKEMETLHKAIVLGNPPKYCQVCKNNEYFVMGSNKDKEGNIYINVVCTKDGCFAQAKLGQYKAGGYFWHKFERYVPKEKPAVEGTNTSNNPDEWDK